MKYITLFVLLFAFPQEKKLSGTYRIEFLKEDGTQSYQLTFDEATYKKRLPDATSSSGKIVYSKYVATLKHDKDNPLEIDLRDAGKDTLRFKMKSRNNSSMKLNEGILIKLPN